MICKRCGTEGHKFRKKRINCIRCLILEMSTWQSAPSLSEQGNVTDDRKG